MRSGVLDRFLQYLEGKNPVLFEKFKALFIQFFKFGLVGVLNTLIFFGIYYGLLFLDVHYILANVIAFIVSTLNAFLLNRKFVFKPDEKKSKVAQFVKVYALYLFTLLLNSGLLFLQVEKIGISEYIAPVLNMFVTIPLNFVLNKYWAFRE